MDILTLIILLSGMFWVGLFSIIGLILIFIIEIVWHTGQIPSQYEMFDKKRKKTLKDEGRNLFKANSKGVWWNGKLSQVDDKIKQVDDTKQG